ncbi:MAG TPA: Maf family protein [Thermodesulfobacteriota bacterium]
MRIVLASASPRRLDLLRRVGLAPEVAPADVDERLLPGEAPDAAARRLAALKADAACRQIESGPAFVIAADTIVAIDGQSLGKPADAAEAVAMLERLSGRTHEVHTGFVVAGAAGAAEGRRVASVVTTRVRVKRLSRAEIDGYVATGEPFGKAGAYAIQGAGAFMVTAVEGSVTNVIGLPLAEVLEALVALGGPGAFGSGA